MKLFKKTSLFLGLSACFLALADTTDTPGTYNVPVKEEELVASSNYNNDYTYHEKDGKIVRIKYDLPLELAGNLNNIDISYTGDASYPWSGELAKGDCLETNGTFKCNLIYEKEKLSIDPEKTEAVIRETFAGNESEIERRLRVAEIFRSEPAGTTSFYR